MSAEIDVSEMNYYMGVSCVASRPFNCVTTFPHFFLRVFLPKISAALAGM